VPDPGETTQASGPPAAEDLLEAVRSLSAQVGSLRGELQALRAERSRLPATGGDAAGWTDRAIAGAGLAWLGGLETSPPRRPALPRLPLELLFLTAVAVAAALAELPWPAVLAAMAGAWALVALAEWLAFRAEQRLGEVEASLATFRQVEDPSWFGPPLERAAPEADTAEVDAPRLPPPAPA